MDQYLVSFEFDMMYWDMVQLIDLIKESGNNDLLPYAEGLQKIVDDETPPVVENKDMCTLNRHTCVKGSGCKYPHCHL